MTVETAVYRLPVSAVIAGATPEEDIFVTEAAVEALRTLRQVNHLPEHYVVRLGVRSGPPARRVPYTLGFDAQVRPEDYEFPVADLRFVVDARSIFYLMGVTLDFADGLLQRGFTFRNPNATRTCGCGHSFAV